jgi:hypothetical protein
MANNNTFHAVYELPVKQRNPHPRGTRKHTRRANINRNIRAHLRHDRQRTQNDGAQLQRMQEEHDKHNEIVESIHLRFYSAINHFQDWDDSRHQIEYDQVLIFRWTQIYDTARNLILDATKGKFRLMDDPTLYQMTHLLWNKAQQMKSLASHGTLSHTSYRWATPMNYERLQHFRQYLATLVTQPLLTPGYTSPILNREFITQQELDEEEQVAIGNLAPPPRLAPRMQLPTWQHSR